jgi:hypothetical protein
MRGPDIREREAWAPERAPDERQPRQAYRNRETLYRLNDDELRALTLVGAFRTVNGKDISQVNLQKLISSGLMQRKTLFLRRGGERAEVLVLTGKGRELLHAQRTESDAQRYYAGLVKPNEVEHDMAIYGAFRDEAASIEKYGGKVRRVVLDYEFKSVINREMNRSEGPSAEERRERLALDFELPVIDDRLALPDLRIEYIDAEGRERHLDVEITTRHYRGSHRAGKARTGFKLVNAHGPRASVIDDHHQGFWG